MSKSLESVADLKNYPISIQTCFSYDEMPSTAFKVLDFKVQKAHLDLLIEYRSQGDPQVQALWDQLSDKFYLVGGAIDQPVQREIEGGTMFILAKVNQAWVSVDLSSLNKTGDLTIFKRNPAVYLFDESPAHHSIKIKDAASAPLLNITLS